MKPYKTLSHLTPALIFIFSCLLPVTAYTASAEDSQNVHLPEKMTGDLDAMKKKRVIRALVVYNKMMFFLDKGQQHGVTYEALNNFEKFINTRDKTKHLKYHVLFIPVRRDQLIPYLVQGRGDIAAANLTITPGRKKMVDFSAPLLENAKEVLVTGKKYPDIKSLDGLSGKTIHVRKTSSYYEHLQILNNKLEKSGKAPIKLIIEDEILEDADLLEMVNANLIPAIIVDDHKARFWAEVFDDIQVHTKIAIHNGSSIAWAFRKNSPLLKSAVDEFVKKNKKGTLMGNILFKRYLKDNKWAKNALNPAELKKYNDVVELFKKYSSEYNFDSLMVLALAFQESGLDHSRKSHVGAIGIMQMMKNTAKDKNVAIPDIEILEKNVKAGTKYLRFLRDRYFSDPKISNFDQTLFSFAAYNAGPARVAKLRKEAREMGLDPNVWFRNVEIIAAKRIGRETVQYVSNITKYFIAYRLIENQEADKKKAKGKKP